MENKNLIVSLGKKYQENYLIRSLIQLLSVYGIGVGSAVDVAFVGIIEQMKKKRLETFFDELAKGELKLTEEVIKSEDFVHRFIITLKAVANERRQEKITFLARLLNNFPLAIGDEKLNDEYEMLLNILDELDYREMYIIVTLYEYEKANPKADGINELQRATKFWGDFEKNACKKLGINSSEFEGYMTRLSRTGLYKEITGGYFDYTGGKGYLTDLLYKLAAYINAKSADFSLN